MYVRNMQTGLMLQSPSQTFLGDLSAGTPVRVQLANGTQYTIPTGPVGSYAWVREASLIAVAYNQIGDTAKAYAWNREYDKRRLVWDKVQAGADLQAILDSMPGDWLTRPLSIIQRVVEWAGETVKDVASTAIDWAKWLPVLLAGGLVVIGIGLSKGTARVRYNA